MATRRDFRPPPQSSSRNRPYLQNASAASSSTANLIPPPRQGPPGRGGSAPHPAFAKGPQSPRRLAASNNRLGGRIANDSAPSISSKYALSADPDEWGTYASINQQEPDDYLHNPDPKRDYKTDRGGHMFTARGLANLGCLLFLCVGLVALFAGYPMLTTFLSKPTNTRGAYNIGGINASGQVPTMPGSFSLIDPDTPDEAQTHTNTKGAQWQLIFSDEFSVDNRTFYPGDDPYWEAVDLWYWETNDMEWYDPGQITTKGGSLVITLAEEEKNDLAYRSGMMSTWNKFCFTGGYIEVNVSLPGFNNIEGLWPAVWTMGNLGRAGYGASLDGNWPYSYDTCDYGTLPNQTLNGQPLAATFGNDKQHGGALSWLPGQKLSRCTCAGEDHPGPQHDDGSYYGRSSPEIDVLEAQAQYGIGAVSQSCQFAPMNYKYMWQNVSGSTYTIYNDTISAFNTYLGSATQQATSVVTVTDHDCYTMEKGCYSVYGYEYQPGPDGYITWFSNGVPAWTIEASGMVADPIANISQRPIPMEPMYLLLNLAISKNFGAVDTKDLVFPVSMLIDYVRIYQDPDVPSVTCDPPDHPTEDYIQRNIAAYSNPNWTTWAEATQQKFPRNTFLNQCEIPPPPTNKRKRDQVASTGGHEKGHHGKKRGWF